MNKYIVIVVFFIFSLYFVPNSIGKKSLVKSFDGVKIAYTIHGTGDTTLVFVHGWCCDQTYWREQISFFSKNFRTVTIDLAGHGFSGRNRTEWTMEAFGEDIRYVIEKLDLSHVILVPHSAGGFSSLEAARKIPDRIIGVIGVDAYRYIKEGYFDRQVSQEKIDGYGEAYIPDFKGPMRELVQTRFFGEQADSNLVNWVADDMADAPPEVAIPCLKAYYYYRNNGLEDALKEINDKIPFVAINIEKSVVDVDYIRKYIPYFDIIYMKEVGHFLMMEDPENFNKLFSEAIAQLRKM